MLTLRNILWLLTLLLYFTALFSIIATAHFSGYEHFLKSMTQENGFFESVSVILLFGIFFYGTVVIYRYRRIFEKRVLVFIGAFALLSLLAAMEEISWGQHLVHFQSSSFFLEHNIQKETNLHNFLDGNLFSSIIYSTVYTLLVFIPLFYKLVLNRYQQLDWLGYFDINPHTILTVLFGSSFQVYFYDDFGAIFDMATLLVALVLFGLFLWIKQSSMMLKIHFAFVLLSTLLFMKHYKIFGFFNMQYEIREMFVVLAALLIFIELIQKQLQIGNLKVQ